MKLSEGFYGKNPSTRQKWTYNSFYLGVILCVIGGYLDFVPSDSWHSFGLKIAFIAGFIITGFIWRAYYTERVKPRIKTNSFFMSLFYLMVPIMSVSFIHVSFTHGLGGLYSAVAGDQKHTKINVHKLKRSSRYFCKFHVEGEYINRAFPSHLCINESSYNKLPETFEIELSGIQSPAGYLIDSFNISKR